MTSQFFSSIRFNVAPILCIFWLFFRATGWAQLGTQIWSYPTTDPILASPAIATDGTIYIGSYDRKLHAVHPDGSRKWTFTLPSSGFTGIYSSPAIGSNGTIYFGAEDGYLYALNPEDGSSQWAFLAGGAVYSDPAIGPDGAIYVGSYDTPRSHLYAINTNGTQRWRYEVSNGIFSDPVVSEDGASVYFGCDDQNLYALNTNGTLRWTFSTGGAITASPALGSDGAVYIGATSSRKLFAVNTDGTKRWEFLAGGSINSSAAIGDDGTIYFGSNDHYLYALNPNGSLKWTAICGGRVESSPALAADGTIYVGCNDGKVYAFDSGGSNLWTFTTGAYVSCSPAIGTNGAVYIGSADQKLYALAGSSALARTPWPMFRHDVRHTAQYAALTNTLPAISSLAGQSVNQNTTAGPLSLTVSDAETPAGNLIVSGTSSNTTLVPNAALLFSGTGSNRFLTITPATNQSGMTLITVTVTDAAGATNSTNFLLTVNAFNQPPQFVQTPNQTDDELTLITITNGATDPDLPAQVLTFNLVSAPTNAAINSASGVFTWTPTEAQGPGTNLIIVSVTDDGSPPLSATQNFVVVVREVNLPPALLPAPNRTVHQGTSVNFQLSATDPDIPANSVTFRLNNAPSGAGVDATTGWFTWVPGANFAGTTTAIEAIVTDNGLPPLSTTNEFMIAVAPPPLLQAAASSNGFVIIWSSIPQSLYRVQYKTNLDAALWSDLPGDVQATGPISAKTNSPIFDTSRFYQVLVLP